MKPIFIRPLTDGERQTVVAGLRSSDALVLRRCQILLASERQERAPHIAQVLGCNDQTVRNVIADFNEKGLAVLQPGSSRPHTIHAAFAPEQAEKLRGLLRQSPRQYGKATSVWTLDLAAEVSFEQGITPALVRGETIRATLVRWGVRWQRAKQWITSPDPAYARKKGARDRLIRRAQQHPDWAVGYEDEVWWSRLAQPRLATWAEAGKPLRLVEQTVAKDDPDPKALACYGLLVRTDALAEAAAAPEQVWLRFVEGRPVSAATIPFLGWCCERLAALGKRALLLVWDNASWHVSQQVRAWLGEHNRAVKRSGNGGRIVVCGLPVKSPWLNPIEPKWVHGKRAVVEPARMLTAQELEDRVCAYYDCQPVAHLTYSEKVS